MKINTGIFLTVVCLTLFSFTLKKVSNKDFTLVSADKQTTFGGMAGSPSITRYFIKVKALRNFTLIKDSAYADGKMDAFEINEDSFKVLDKKVVKKGKIITLSFNIVTPTEMGGSNYQVKIPGSPEAKLPITSKTGVVLRYKGGKSKYLDIDTIKTLESFYAP